MLRCARLLIILGSLFSARAQIPTPDTFLPLGSTLNVHLNADAPPVFRLQVPVGQCARLTLHDRQSAAGRVTVLDGGGAVAMRSVPGWTVAAGLTLLSGSYQIRVEPAFKGEVEGTLSLTASLAENATDMDRERNEADRLEGEGQVVFADSQPGYVAAALEKFSAALKIREQLGESIGLANILWAVGEMQVQQGRLPEALATYQRELKLWEKAEVASGMFETLYMMGNVQSASGKPKEALATLDLALAKHTEDTNLRDVSGCHLIRATAQAAIGQNALAREELDEAMRSAVESGSPVVKARVQVSKGIFEFQQGNYSEASELYRSALAVYRLNSLQGLASQVLSNLGSVASDSGDPRTAVEYFEEVLPIRKSLSPPGSYATTLYNLAVAREELGEYQAALDALQEALPIFRQAHHAVGEAYSLQELALVWEDLGNLPKAEDLAKEALTLRRATSDRRGESQVLVRLSQIYAHSSRVKDALDASGKALLIAQQDGYALTEAMASNEIGATLLLEKDYKNALTSLARSLEVSRKLGNKREEERALQRQAEVLEDLGDLTGAKAAAEAAISLQREFGDEAGEMATLHLLAKIEMDLKNIPEARTKSVESVNVLESLRANIRTAEARMQTAGLHRQIYDSAVEFAMKSQDPEGALEMAERARARGLIDLLAETHVDLRRGVDPSLSTEQRRIEEQLDARHERLMRLMGAPHAATRETALRKELDLLLEHYQEVQGKIRAASPAYAAIAQPRTLTLPELQSSLPPSGTALVEFWLAENTSYAWVVTRTECKGFQLPGRSKIEAAARIMNQAAAASDGRFTSAAGTLSQMLNGPLTAAAKFEKLWIVSDGALEYVPMAALQASGKKVPLAAEHQIFMLASGSAAAALQRVQEGRKPAAGEVAVFADPVFSRKDERMLPAVSAADSPREGGAPLTRLHFSRDEAEAIAGLAGAAGKWIALDFDATRSAAESSRLAGYRVVHFATHGLIDSRHPELSGIALTMVDRAGRPVDGFLPLHRIYDLKLNADLVVLSGCETALGEEVRSEGLVGLTRGFMYAGSSQVLASLWSVHDRATAEFMRRFYDALLRRKLDAGGALHSAQLSMMHDARWSNPVYWSAFVLQGSGNSR